MQFTRNLQPDARRIFELCYYKGLSHSAAASVTGLTETEVSRILNTAMVELRKFMKSNWK